MFGKRMAAMPKHAPAVKIVVGAIALIGGLAPARADIKVHYPIIDYREFEFEYNGDTTFDKAGSGKSNNQSNVFELGYAPVWWWEPEIEFETKAAPGQNFTYDATTFENTFQLTEQGKYWADLGFFAEYSHAASRADADEITFGPLVQKQTSDILGLDLGHDTLHTLNVLFTKQIGRNRNDATPLSIAWQSRIQFNPYFQPGVEYYADITSIAGTSNDEATQHRLGPVLVGQYNMFQLGKIKYEVGYLFGLNRATEQGTLRWRLEYEKAF